MNKKSSFRGARTRNLSKSARSAHSQFESLENRQMLAMAANDAINDAIQRLSVRSQYEPAALRVAREWAFQVAGHLNLVKWTKALGATSVTASPFLSGVYTASFPAKLTGQAIASAFDQQKLTSASWPLIAKQQTPRAVPNDPRFVNQWHLQNTGQSGGVVGADANIVNTWNSYTGTGVTIGVVDDGTTPTHEDLAPNYVAADSWDFNGNDANPDGGSHGSSVSGVALAVQNNSKGGSGAAPNASLAGLKLIAAPATDAQEAGALSYHKDNIDIYTNSWGPNDGGTTLEGPGPLTLAAFADVVQNGRGGLGGIYTWAGGNGGNGDNVNFDGYANSRYTIAIGAITNAQVRSSYSERGASLLVGAYSDGGTLGINTTAGSSNTAYTTTFGGTSSAAPLAAGVIALMLQANPSLTWRDVQAILVNSAEKVNPTDSGWSDNGAGHHINDKYGYGGIDAAAATSLAASWTNLAPEISATTGTVNVNQSIPNNDLNGLTYSFSVGAAIKMETVELVFNATHNTRGELQVILTSPNGTQSIMATERTDTGDNYTNWMFTTKRLWDENSAGTWSIKVIDDSGTAVGTFNSFKMNIYGTNAVSTPAIFGSAFDDANGNGTRDGGELGLNNVTVFDDANGNSSFDVGEPSDTTDATGSYTIDNLSLGSHTVRVIAPAGLRGTTPASQIVALSVGDTFETGVNFGFTNPRIAGVVFNDANDNGVKDTGELGLSGVTVYLDNDNSGTLNAGDTSTTSAADGSYSLGGLNDGTYTVRVQTPAGRRLTLPAGNGSYTANISNASLVFNNDDFALTDRVRITGVAFRDDDGNGVRDIGEPPIVGTRVFEDLNGNSAYDSNIGTFNSTDVPKTVVDLATTDSNLVIAGVGSITSLTVKINITHGWDSDLDISLVSPTGTIIDLSSDNGSSGDNYVNTVFDDAAATLITAGSPPYTGSFKPEQALSTLAGQAGSGTWKLRMTDDESGFAGTLNSWSITLNSTEPSQLTDVNGAYSFNGLAPGTHAFRQVAVANHVFTNPASGGVSLNAVGGDLLTTNFGNFPTSYAGSNMTLRLDAAGTKVQVWVDNALANPPSFTADKTILTTLSFTGTAGDDSLTVDAQFGNPLPTGGITYAGAGNGALGDMLFIKGSTGADTVVFNAGNASLGGRSITETLVERAAFDGRLGGDSLTVNSGSPIVQISGAQRFSSLNVASGATAAMNANGSNLVVVTGTLSVAGKFDLADNDMLVKSGVATLGGIETLIKTALGNSTWNGPSGLLSSTARDSAGQITTLAAISGQQYADNAGATVFDGENVLAGDTLVKYTYFGDVDFNGQVDTTDYNIIDFGFLTGASGWANGDVDYNSQVDTTDYNLIDFAFLTQAGIIL